MSRIGQQEILILDGVNVVVEGRRVSVKGKVGELFLDLPEGINATVQDKKIRVARESESRLVKSCHGLSRNLLANMVEGVSRGFSKDLSIQGVGFKAALKGKTLLLSLGFSGPVEYGIPDGVTVKVEGDTSLRISGADKQKVGDTAARIRSFFPAEPYKGKGVRYRDEHVRRKVGKTVA